MILKIIKGKAPRNNETKSNEKKGVYLKFKVHHTQHRVARTQNPHSSETKKINFTKQSKQAINHLNEYTPSLSEEDELS